MDAHDPKLQEHRFEKARARLLIAQPFFGALLLRLKPVQTSGVKTMATDGVRLWWNPSFVASLDDTQIKTVMAHEVMHCALMHHTRRQQRDAKRWNKAGDHAINLELAKLNWTRELPGWLCDQAFAEMYEEQIYNILPDEKSDDGESNDGESDDGESDDGESDDGESNDGESNDDESGDDESGDDESDDDESDDGESNDPDAPPKGADMDDPGGCGVVLDAPAETPQERQEIEEEWKIATVQAATVAPPGSLPGSLVTMIEKLREPVVDWREQLRDFVSRIARGDYSWRRPNRRMAWRQPLPGLYSEECGEIVIVCDTSGSTMTMRETFASEIDSILSDVRPSRVHVIYIDTRVIAHDEWEPNTDPFEFKSLGNGGTAFAPAFRYVEDNITDCDALIYFTDMEAGDYDQIVPPPFPVLWADCIGRSASFYPGWGDYLQVTK